MDDKVPIGTVEFNLAKPIKVDVHTYNDHLSIKHAELPPGPYMGDIVTPESKATTDDKSHWFVRLPAYVEIPYLKLMEELRKHPGDPNLMVNSRCIDLSCEGATHA
jgi:hypothetical protein